MFARVQRLSFSARFVHSHSHSCHASHIAWLKRKEFHLHGKSHPLMRATQTASSQSLPSSSLLLLSSSLTTSRSVVRRSIWTLRRSTAGWRIPESPHLHRFWAREDRAWQESLVHRQNTMMTTTAWRKLEWNILLQHKNQWHTQQTRQKAVCPDFNDEQIRKMLASTLF